MGKKNKRRTGNNYGYRINIYIPKLLHQVLKEQAKKENRTVSNLIRTYIFDRIAHKAITGE